MKQTIGSFIVKNEGDPDDLKIRTERATVGPIEDALSYISPEDDWNDRIMREATARGVPVCEALLAKRNENPFAPPKSPVTEPTERLEKRAHDKRTFWLTKMQANQETDWDAAIERIAERDPRSAHFLRKLVAQYREMFGDEE